MKISEIIRVILAASACVAGLSSTAKALSALAMADVPVPFVIGDIKADPGRNFVYLLDQTDNLILKIDTSLGQVTGSASVEDGQTTGVLTVSIDDSKLYLAESTEDKILVFSLPDLTPLPSLLLNFSPEDIVAGAGGGLYCSEYGINLGFIAEISGTDGSVLQSFGRSESYYTAPLLRTNATGTNLYAATTSELGYVPLYKYDISGPTASSATAYTYDNEATQDFSPDEDNGKIYVMCEEFDGINVILTENDDYSTIWPVIHPPAEAVSYTESGTVVFGAAGFDVRTFSRTDGDPLTDNVSPSNDATFRPGGMATTPNGNTVYVRGYASGSTYVGILGLNHLNVPGAPVNFPFQNGTLLGYLSVNSSFAPSAWLGIGSMGAGWQERAVADIDGDGVPDIFFQNGTNIGALIMNSDGTPKSWIGIGSMNAGWELRGAAYIINASSLDLIFQNGTSLGFLSIASGGDSPGAPIAWTGIGTMQAGWQLRAVANLTGEGQPNLIFQNGTAIGSLELGANGVPVSWTDIGTMNPGWVLSYAADLDGDGQPDLLFQNGTLLGALQVNTSLQPTGWTGIGAMNAGWVAPGDY